MGRIDAYIVTSKNLYIIVPMECVFFEFSKGLNTRNDISFNISDLYFIIEHFAMVS